MLYSSRLLVTYFSVFYISILTTIIEIITCDFFFNNNIVTQSTILLLVFSKYVLSRIRNIFSIKRNQAMISIFARAFDLGNIFLKSKTKMDEDKKENFRMEIVKKALFSQRSNMSCWSLPTSDFSHMRN